MSFLLQLPLQRNIYVKLLNYWRVGYLLHVIGICSVVLSLVIGHYVLQSWNENDVAYYVFLSWLSSFFFMNGLFSQLDAYSRYQNFKQIRDQFYLRGFETRLANTMQKSKCQRLAAIKAAEANGIGEAVKEHYYKNGYRWYHILPDFFLKNPLFLFHPYFWKTTFFGKYYQTRYYRVD